jgi:hypothetical protein
MRTVRITYRIAAIICRHERCSWSLLQQGESLLLASGAKLYKRGRYYWIGGDSANGRDVEIYLETFETRQEYDRRMDYEWKYCMRETQS